MFNVRNLRSVAVLLLASAAFFGVAASCSTANYEPKTVEEAAYLQQVQLAEAKAWAELATSVAWTVHAMAAPTSRTSRSSGEPTVAAETRILRTDVTVLRTKTGYVAVVAGKNSVSQGAAVPDLESAKADGARLAYDVSRASPVKEVKKE